MVSKPQDKMAETTPGNPTTKVGQHTPKERAGDRPRERSGRRF